jgi:hypothetical protein
MVVKPTGDDGAIWNNAAAWADAAQREIENVILPEAGADPICGNNNKPNEKSRRKHDAANPEAIDQTADKRGDRGQTQIVKGKSKGDGASTDVKILRNGFEENAEGIDGYRGFAEEKAHGGDGDNPPSVEKAHMS